MTELLITLRTVILSVIGDAVGQDYFLGVAEGKPEFPYVVVNDDGSYEIDDSTSQVEIDHRMITVAIYSEDDSIARNLLSKVTKRLTRGAALRPANVNVLGIYKENEICRQEENREPGGLAVWQALGSYRFMFQEE